MSLQNKKPKIIALLRHSNQELKKYKKTGKFVNLSQACEKTWVAFNLLLEFKSGKEITDSDQIRPTAESFGLGGLFQECRFLHVLHYEGSAGIDRWEVVGSIISAHKQIKQAMR